MGDLDLLIDFAVAFLVVITVTIYACIAIRNAYQRAHPPLTQEEREAQLESGLAEINKKIEEIG